MEQNTDQRKIKKCRVCQSPASGFNYGGLSCEKCKVFFHRNHNKLKALKCVQLDNNCTIDQFRRRCSRCRLQKCIVIGMVKPENSSVKKNNDQIINSESLTLHEILKCNNNLKESIKITKFRKRQKPASLSVHEQQILTELQNSLSAVFEDETKLELVGTVTNVEDAFNLPALYAKRIIKFCKSMPPFKALKEEDQFLILKHFYLKILNLRIAFVWSSQQSGYPVIENESGTRAVFMHVSLSKMIKCQDIVQYNIRQTNLMHDAIERDPTIRDLLIAQALFQPISDLSSLEFVSYHFSVYRSILLKYLQIKYAKNQRKAHQKFVVLQNIMKEFECLLQNSERLFKTEFKNSKKANEIMGEVLNFM